jgi:hypothetical protein
MTTGSNEGIERTTGVEITPPEPEQRSYLRREAPSVVSTDLLLLVEELQQKVLIPFIFLIVGCSKVLVSNRCGCPDDIQIVSILILP